MIRDAFGRVAEFVTEHNVLVLVLGLVLSAGVVAGISQLQMQSEASSDGVASDSEVAQKQAYIEAHYDDGEERQSAATRVVYLRDDDGNVLSKAALLESLRFQRDVFAADAAASIAAPDRRVVGVANAVGKAAAGDQSATLSEQIAALEAASESEVASLVERTLVEGSPALRLLPNDYEPGTATATSRRTLFRFSGEPDAVTDAQRVLYEQANAQSGVEYFTVGEHAQDDYSQQAQENVFELILPVSLAVILAVLAFSYRDLVDIVVGFAGVVLSVLWMFGILGWLGVAAGNTLVIGPVLIVGLSVDYGLHVFMRYREERGDDDGVRESMTRSLSSVAVALGLVTLTTAVGFMSNVANGVTTIQNLAVGITLGVLSAFVIFVTIVPAAKVTVDRLLTRVGLRRQKDPLGTSGYLEPVLAGGVKLAKRGAPVVVALALVAGLAGGAAWTQLDQQGYQQQTGEAAEWKQNLPEPLAWEVPEMRQDLSFVQAHYRSTSEDDQRASALLVEGNVTADNALDPVQDAKASLTGVDAVFARSDGVPFESPVSVMQSVASENDEFAGVLADADTDGDGVPERDLKAVYDALYAASPDAASRVVERTDGEYRSVRVLVPFDATASYEAQAGAMDDAEAVVDDTETLSATGVGTATLTTERLSRIVDSILQTLVLALAAVFALLLVVYRLGENSWSLGAITGFPIALVTALVVGGMFVLDVPLTLLTALLLSLVVGLGIDYAIHVSDRFAHERRNGADDETALYRAVTGTGGALLGSTLTSVGAFSALLLHPHPQIQSFGTLVVLALGLSFLVSVFVLPSFLLLWSRRAEPAPQQSRTADPAPTDD